MEITENNSAEFIKTEQTIHNQARIIGALAKTYIPPVDDGSHTNMAWNEDRNRLETRDFVGKNDEKFFVSYEPKTFHFHINNNQNRKTIETKQKSLADILNEFEAIFESFGFDGNKFKDTVEFRFPEMFDENEILLIPKVEMLPEFEKIRSAANQSLKTFLNNFNQKSEIRVWEHNFDTGIYCQYESDIEQFAGYSTADKEASDVPYFYNSMVNKKQTIAPLDFPKLTHGYWETNRWSGAILPFTEFKTTKLFLENATLFLEETTKIFLSKVAS